MKYAAIYAVAERDLSTPRRATAAARIALYIARRAARREGHEPIAGHVRLDIGTPAKVNGIPVYGDGTYAMRAEIEVA